MNRSYIYKPAFYIYIFSYTNTVTMIGILVALYVKVLGVLVKESSAWHSRFLLKSILTGSIQVLYSFTHEFCMKLIPRKSQCTYKTHIFFFFSHWASSKSKCANFITSDLEWIIILPRRLVFASDILLGRPL